MLAPWLIAHIEHVGSTAIPDLPAKPIIDLQAPVSDLARSRPDRTPGTCDQSHASSGWGEAPVRCSAGVPRPKVAPMSSATGFNRLGGIAERV
ncbi:GrpB family protein [Mycobacterium sp.]|uniref:GrpB family protein n=1 Tax=Mycobacterium sp. TaxID=1785 RepID=UPI003C71D9BA